MNSENQRSSTHALNKSQDLLIENSNKNQLIFTKASGSAKDDDFALFCQIANARNTRLQPLSNENLSRSRSFKEPRSISNTCVNADVEKSPNLSRNLAQRRSMREIHKHSNFVDRQPTADISGNGPVEPPTQIYRVRSFKRTDKGKVISQGEVVRTRECTVSGTNLNSDNLGLNHYNNNLDNNKQIYTSGATSTNVPQLCVTEITNDNVVLPEVVYIAASNCTNGNATTINQIKSYRITVMGAARVGKSTLCDQFMTAENNMHSVNSDTENDTSNQEKFVSVLVDGVETNLTFVDTSNAKSVLDSKSEAGTAFMVVYAVDDEHSFVYAKNVMIKLREKYKKSTCLILAANKCDLARTREITADDGRKLASVYNALFLEVSTTLGHGIDDLLVGIISRINNHMQQLEKENQKQEKGAQHHTSFSISKFFRKHFFKSSSNCSTTN